MSSLSSSAIELGFRHVKREPLIAFSTFFMLDRPDLTRLLALSRFGMISTVAENPWPLSWRCSCCEEEAFAAPVVKLKIGISLEMKGKEMTALQEIWP
jgi:hypothetical protein